MIDSLTLLWGLVIFQLIVCVYIIAFLIVWCFTDDFIEEEEIEEYEVAKCEIPSFSHFDELKGNPCYSEENSCCSKL